MDDIGWYIYDGHRWVRIDLAKLLALVGEKGAEEE